MKQLKYLFTLRTRQETILLLQAAVLGLSYEVLRSKGLRNQHAQANWDGLAAPALNARILRAAALVDANLLYKMLQAHSAIEVAEH